MGASTIHVMIDRREDLRGMLLLSVALHSLLFVLAITYTTVGRRVGGAWGRGWGGGGSARISTVASLPGVPLPAPLLTGRSATAVDSPGLYRTQPSTPREPEKTAEQIPKFKEATRPERAERIAKRIQPQELDMPDHAVPFGLGGKPSFTYSQIVNAAGEGGIGFGEAGFGDRYSWYVNAVRNRISSNWLLSTISPHITRAPRVYLNFDILRDGTITNVRIVQSSGIPEVDRSALRAVLASTPLGPLPTDYSGSRVSVEFFFDFQRR